MSNNYLDQLICPSSFPWQYATIEATDSFITSIMFTNTPRTRCGNALINSCKHQLTLFFDKKLSEFNIPFKQDYTDFTQSVWNELMQIQYGQTASYKDIATKLGSKNKSRAVGRACGLNKISIVVPCHRVIGTTQRLTGYAGGIATKLWLIEHEKNKKQIK